jgi:hypothetical protein
VSQRRIVAVLVIAAGVADPLPERMLPAHEKSRHHLGKRAVAGRPPCIGRLALRIFARACIDLIQNSRTTTVAASPSDSADLQWFDR